MCVTQVVSLSLSLTLANCLSLLLGLCEVVTTILGSSTPAQAYSSSTRVVAARSSGGGEFVCERDRENERELLNE